MKTFLISKMNILLSMLLVGVLGTGAVLGVNVLRSNTQNKVPDFLGKDKNEAISWCGQLSSSDACEFIYEDTTNTQEGQIFQQSISAGQKFEGKITFKVSSGIIVEVDAPVLNANSTKQDIENWKNENNITIVNYIEENSDTIAKGIIIRIEPTTGIRNDTPVSVYISAGKKEDNTASKAEGIEVKSGAYLDLTVGEFETKVKALGLVPNHRSSNDDSSTSIRKGNIVWHGSGTYEKGETINYGICTEEVKGIVVKEGAYVGKSEADFKKEAEALGLTPTHLSSRDDYSSSIAKGNIVSHGFGTYEKSEKINYGLSLGPKNDNTATGNVIVKSGQYVGKSEEEFKSIAAQLGLKANHDSGRDANSSTVAKGSIVTHGYGNYVPNETFNYGLSLGPKDGQNSSSSIQISEGQYVGKSEADVISATKTLGLTPTHLTERDAYSSTVAAGNVVTHGFGSYVKNEAFNYGLSLGPKPVVEKVNVENKAGSSEADFKTYLQNLGMKAGTRSEAYSSTIAEGLIVSNDSGSYDKGSSINYTVSIGVEPEKMCVLNAFSDLSTEVLSTNDFEGAKNKMIAYLDNAGFTNYTINGAESRDDGAGVLMSVYVNGVNHLSRTSYPASASIVVTISTGYSAS